MKKIISSVFLLLLVLSACASPAAATEPASSAAATDAPLVVTEAPMKLTEINLCYNGSAMHHSVFWYGLERGIFEQYGLKVNMSYISGGSKAVTALITGDVDACQVGAAAVVNAVAAGEDVVMIAGFYNVYPAALYVKPEIKTAEDLKGKTLAVFQPGSATYVGTQLVLEQLGLIPNEDVFLLTVGEDSERVAALYAGQVDGTLISPPITLDARSKGYVNLFDLAESKIPYQFTGVATTREYIENNRSTILALEKAIIDTITQMKKDPDGVKEASAKYMDLDVIADAENLSESYLIVLNILEAIPYPTLPGIQTIINTLISENPDVAGLTPEQIVDQSLLDELKASGFIDEIQK